jgi:hypothetical protein
MLAAGGDGGLVGLGEGGVWAGALLLLSRGELALEEF